MLGRIPCAIGILILIAGLAACASPAPLYSGDTLAEAQRRIDRATETAAVVATSNAVKTEAVQATREAATAVWNATQAAMQMETHNQELTITADAATANARQTAVWATPTYAQMQTQVAKQAWTEAQQQADEQAARDAKLTKDQQQQVYDAARLQQQMADEQAWHDTLAIIRMVVLFVGIVAVVVITFFGGYKIIELIYALKDAAAAAAHARAVRAYLTRDAYGNVLDYDTETRRYVVVVDSRSRLPALEPPPGPSDIPDIPRFDRGELTGFIRRLTRKEPDQARQKDILELCRRSLEYQNAHPDFPPNRIPTDEMIGMGASKWMRLTRLLHKHLTKKPGNGREAGTYLVPRWTTLLDFYETFAQGRVQL